MSDDGNGQDNDDRLIGQSWTSIIMALVVYSIAFFIGLYNTEEKGENWWLVSLAVIGCHIFLSIKTVKPNEWGALLFLNRAMKQLRDGPVFAFWPFFDVVTEVRTVFQVIVGTAPTDKDGKPIEEAVQAEEGVTILREREPFRVNFLTIEALPKAEELRLVPDSFPPEFPLPVVTDEMVKRFKGDPLHGPLTCDPQLVFWFDIKNYLDYLKVVHDVVTLSRNISGIAKATLQECAGRITVGMLIAYNELVCRRLTYRIEQLIGEPHAQRGLVKANLYWGVNFRAIQIYSPGLPRTVNVSLSQNTAAGYDSEKITKLSEAERKKRINEGVGAAEAERVFREAEAIGAEKLAAVASKPEGLLVLQLKAMQEAVKSGNVTLLPMDLSAFGSLVATAKAMTTSKS